MQTIGVVSGKIVDVALEDGIKTGLSSNTTTKPASMIKTMKLLCENNGIQGFFKGFYELD